MRSNVGQPVRLQDYVAPDFLIDTVEMDISLDRRATKVVATLGLRPRPGAAPGAALRLDGDDLNLVGVHLDGVALTPSQ